jgi:hypothetical protein
VIGEEPAYLNDLNLVARSSHGLFGVGLKINMTRVMQWRLKKIFL